LKTFFFLLTFFLSSSVVFSQSPEEKLYEQCLQPTIRLIAPKERSVGTAFVVRSELHGNVYRNAAITAAHCTTCSKYFVNIPSYDSKGKLLKYITVPAFIYAMEQDDDLAIVLFETEDKLATTEWDFSHSLKYGEKVFHFGFGLGDDARLDDGKVTAVSSRNYKNKIRTNVYTVGGDSGGPLFNQNNKVIGICQSVRCDAGILYHNISFYTPVQCLKSWDELTNNAFSFVYNSKAKMPRMAFIMLSLDQYEIGVKNANVCCPLMPKASP
jgi:S1-C subfamily serine protease